MGSDRTLKKQKMSVLQELKKITTIVADTGDFEGKYGNLIQTAIIARSARFQSELKLSQSGNLKSGNTNV